MSFIDLILHNNMLPFAISLGLVAGMLLLELTLSLLGISLFGGSEAELDADVAVDTDVDFDADFDADLEVEFDVDADVAAELESPVTPGAGSDVP